MAVKANKNSKPGKKRPLQESTTVQVADRLHSLAIRLLRLVRVEDTATGIGPARLSALSVLVFGGAMSLKQLAAAEQVKPPTMSRIVAGMEHDGLVRRVVLKDDRREVRLYATAKGVRILQEGRARRVAHLAERLRGLEADDIKALGRAAELMLKLVAGG